MGTAGRKGNSGYRPKPRSGQQSFGKNIGRLILLILAGFFIYVFIAGDYGLYRIFTQMRLRSQLRAKIEQLRREREELKGERRKLTEDLYYIERKAREEHGMVKEGERIYRVIILGD